MKDYIFYYFTEELTTRETKMFVFDSYQGDIGEWIITDDGLIYEIVDYTWEFHDLEDEMMGVLI